jgi:hypothetical protein
VTSESQLSFILRFSAPELKDKERCGSGAMTRVTNIRERIEQCLKGTSVYGLRVTEVMT